MRRDTVRWDYLSEEGRFMVLPFGWLCDHEGFVRDCKGSTYSLSDQRHRFVWSMDVDRFNTKKFVCFFDCSGERCTFVTRVVGGRCNTLNWETEAFLGATKRTFSFTSDDATKGEMTSLSMRFTLRPLNWRAGKGLLSYSKIMGVHGWIYESLVLSAVASYSAYKMHSGYVSG